MDRESVERGFVDFVRSTCGHEPYPYQVRIAVEGLPELLSVPTGAGKTLAAVLPWYFRRRLHPNPVVRAATPRQLVFVLPMRVLVEQTADTVRRWMAAADPGGAVVCETLLGGESRLNRWRRALDRDVIVIGTLDMIISRALNRGYGESRFIWPIDFGLLNSGCHYVFDEVQLMGPALATSRQLHGLRTLLGTIEPCTSTWMSATIPEAKLATVDAPAIAGHLELTDEDRSGPLGRRLGASKRLVELDAVDAAQHPLVIAAFLASEHCPGTLTLAVLNTVQRARATHARLAELAGPEVVLLHSRFRPIDRRRQVDRALSPVDPNGSGRIVVSTQVVEAGVDVSARVMLTELAPWPSLVQRAGRCNRDGLADDALLAWIPPPNPAPYEPADLDATMEELRQLTDEAVTPESLGDRDVAVTEVIEPVLRRKDLLDLFDTMPDLSGNDLDVARFIRPTDELDVAVAWRDIGDDGLAPDTLVPGRDERCPVPVTELRKLIKTSLDAWRFDHLSGRWVPVRSASDVRPGVLVIIAATAGSYTPESGWDPSSKRPVAVVHADPAADDQAMADDPASVLSQWVELAVHLADTRAAAATLLSLLPPTACPSSIAEAVVTAAALHDVGKAHPVFQTSLRQAMDTPTTERPAPADDIVLAKSGGSGRLRHGRRYFRHELASALALLGEGAVALRDVAEPDLVVYLVAAHHGRVRIGLRPMPDEAVGSDLVALGIHDGERLPAVVLHDGELPASTLDLSVIGLGERNGRRSWSARALELRDRSDLGPFRLGYLEAVVRLADWAASELRDREGVRA